MPIHQIEARISLIQAAFESCYPAIFRYFRYKGADVDTANDRASSVFERAFSNIDQYDPRIARIQTWLFAIARNLAINHWKSQLVNSTTVMEDELLVQDSPSLEDHIIILQDKEMVLQAMQTLDERAVEIISLKFGGSLTNREISRLTGLSESNVGVILYRSLIKLRSLLAIVQTEAP